MSTISASTTTTTAYKVTADTTGKLDFQTGSGPATNMTLDASGRLGIGSTSPTYALDILNSSSPQIRQTRALVIDAPRTLGALIGSGYSVGTTIVESAQIAFVSDTSWTSTSAPTYMSFSTTASGSTTATERARIDSSGNLLVGTTSAANASRIVSQYPGNTTLGFTLIDTTAAGGTAVRFYTNTTGFVGSITTSSSATAYNTSSDYRLKDITGPVTGAKDFIMALQPKQGTWKSDGSPFVGFLAHEFQEVSPSSVVGTKDAVDADGNPIMQAMQASSPEVMANLVAFIQEQQAIIQQLQADVAALKGA